MPKKGEHDAAAFGNVTMPQVCAYADKLKSAGFTADAEVTDMNQGGMEIYSYAAKNSAGVFATIMSVAGSVSMGMEE